MINKKLYVLLLTISLGLYGVSAKAETTKLSGVELEAEKLLDTMKMGATLEAGIEKLINVQIQQNPGMAPYRAVLLEFFGKHMNYERLKGDLVFIYAEAYSEKELKAINKFYASDVGQKTINLMPELMAKGSQVGQQRVQDNIPELQRMIQEESVRILELQNEQE